MAEQNKVTTIFKSNDPEELIIFRATSLQNEIRFYLNNTLYFTAIESEKGYSIKLEEEKGEKIEECNKLCKNSIIIVILKSSLKLLKMILEISLLGFIAISYLEKTIYNILILLIVINLIHIITNFINVIIIEISEITPEIKSKHSAEHMIVNFLKINKRLPNNIEEIKKYSRFSQECSSIKLIKGIAEEFIQGIFASIFTFIVSIIVSYFSFNLVTNVIVFLSTYYLVKFFVGKSITKYGTLQFIIKPIKKVLNNIAQCANTTQNVKDRDIILAYSVAKQWLKIVYPEFYNENTDIFCK